MQYNFLYQRPVLLKFIHWICVIGVEHVNFLLIYVIIFQKESFLLQNDDIIFVNNKGNVILQKLSGFKIFFFLRNLIRIFLVNEISSTLYLVQLCYTSLLGFDEKCPWIFKSFEFSLKYCYMIKDLSDFKDFDIFLKLFRGFLLTYINLNFQAEFLQYFILIHSPYRDRM